MDGAPAFVVGIEKAKARARTFGLLGLVVAEGYHWVDSAGSSCWEVAGEDGYC